MEIEIVIGRFISSTMPVLKKTRSLPTSNPPLKSDRTGVFLQPCCILKLFKINFGVRQGFFCHFAMQFYEMGLFGTCVDVTVYQV